MPLLAFVTVRGPSMAPAVRSGDRVLARRVRPARRVRSGAVVLVAWASRPDVLAVKRVVRPTEGGYWVEGDNPAASDDSRTFGAATVLAIVLGRCWPWPPRISDSLRR